MNYTDRKQETLNYLDDFWTYCEDVDIPARCIYRDLQGYFLKEDLGDEVGPPQYILQPLSPYAEGQLLSLLRMPASYIHRCPNSLQATNINYWLKTRGSKKIRLRKHSGRVRGITSTRYNTELDDHNTYKLLFEVVDEYARQNNIREEQIYLRPITKEDDYTIARLYIRDIQAGTEDVAFWAGVEIVNSEVGRSSLWIRPVNRGGSRGRVFEYCDTAEDGCTRITHLSKITSAGLSGAFRDALETAQVGIHRLLEASREVVERPVEDLEALALNSQVLTNRIVSCLKEQFEKEERITKLSFIQDILRATAELPIFKKHLAEKEAGHYLSLFRDAKNRISSIVEEIEEVGE